MAKFLEFFEKFKPFEVVKNMRAIFGKSNILWDSVRYYRFRFGKPYRNFGFGNFGIYQFRSTTGPRESVLWGSRALSAFCTSLSKVLILWHCVKVKQHYLSLWHSTDKIRLVFLLQNFIVCSKEKGTTHAQDSPLKYSTKSFVIQYISAPSQPHSISVKKQSRRFLLSLFFL